MTVAHRLAAAVIAYQTRSGLLRHTRSGLAFALRSATAPAAPPTFAEVTARVEQDEGIRFAQLFERLPKRSKHGDAAVTAVWKMAVVSNNPGWQGIPRVAHGEMDKRSGATRERAIKIPGIAHGAVLTIPGVTHADAMKIPGVTHIVAWKQPRVTYAGVTKAPGVVYGQAIRIPSTTHEAHIHLLRKPRA